MNNQPKPYDVVLGSTNLLINGSVVLGGLEGCKRRLSSATEDVLLKEIVNAAQYGEQGRSVAVAALHNFVINASLSSVLLLLTWTEGRDIFLETFQGLNDIERQQLYSTVNPNTTNQIKKLTELGKAARFKNYASLKVGGKDSFSSLSKKELSQLTNRFTGNLIESEDKFDSTAQAAAMRWYLRGLSVDNAIHKVRVDQEISENATQARYKAKH